MSKILKWFQVEIRKDDQGNITAFARYNVSDDVYTDLSKYGEKSVTITTTDSVDTVLTNVESEIKTDEGIS